MPGCGVRTLAGDVFFDNFKYPDTQLGGLVLTPGVTKAICYFMIDMIIIFPSEYFLGNDNGEMLQRHSQLLLAGKYYIASDGKPFSYF